MAKKAKAAEDKKITAGGPPLFKTPKDMQKAIDNHLANLPLKTMYAKDGSTYEMPIISITSLCLALGFCSRQSFYDYEKREEFSYTVKRARLIIEQEYETQLQHGNTVGAIFALKNMGWIDKSVVDSTVNFHDLSEQELEARIKALENEFKS